MLNARDAAATRTGGWDGSRREDVTSWMRGVGEEFGGEERGGEEVAGEVDGYDAELVGAGCVELGDFGDDGEDGLLRVFCEVAAYAGVDEGEAEEVDEGEEG